MLIIIKIGCIAEKFISCINYANFMGAYAYSRAYR